MRRLILAFLLLLVAIIIGIQLRHDPGYVLISFRHWTVETSLSIAVIGAFIFGLFFYLVVSLLNKLIHLPHHIKSWQQHRRTAKSQLKTRKGLIEFSEGDWGAAKNDLIKALPASDAPLLNYLTAARAAQELGDSQARDDYLREAQQSVPEARVAIELTQAQLQLANKQWEQALATLRHLQDIRPKHPYVLKLLLRLYQEVRDWPHLIKLLPQIKKYRIVSNEEFTTIELETYRQFLSDLTKNNNRENIHQFLKDLPRHLQEDPEIMAIYCQYLIENKEYLKVEPILRTILRKQFSDSLIRLYGLFHLSDKQLSFAESLQKKAGDSAALYLCLGRLAIGQHLWGKAKNYLTKSISIKPTPTAYNELGNLYEHFGERNEATNAFRNGLNLVEAGN